MGMDYYSVEWYGVIQEGTWGNLLWNEGIINWTNEEELESSCPARERRFAVMCLWLAAYSAGTIIEMFDYHHFAHGCVNGPQTKNESLIAYSPNRAVV